MKKIELDLTEEEIGYLIIEMNCLLRSYRKFYKGQRYDNSNMGSAFNKVFKVLTGEDHERYLEVNSK